MPIPDSPMHQRQRARLIRDAIGQLGDAHICNAMARLPRHAFLPDDAQGQAYVDAPVSIGAGQTISQPSLIAHMLGLLQLQAGMRVLDIGAGSGYVTALLAMLVGPDGQVFARERQGRLAARALDILPLCRRGDWARIDYEHGDGFAGWPEQAPYHAIHVGAVFPRDHSALEAQLAIGGRLIQPITRDDEQVLQLVERVSDDDWRRQDDLFVRFVPMLPGLEC
jgi:protein-L-isoaspartate(D-aspartate) O-methyltransferase